MSVRIGAARSARNHTDPVSRATPPCSDRENGPAMSTPSVLFRTAACAARAHAQAEPDYLGDLNLDQVIAAVTAGKEEYDLEPFFRMPLDDADDVLYRQEVMRDLERLGLPDDLTTFAHSMRAVRRHLEHVEKSRYELQRQRWFLDAVDAYCEAVSGLGHVLSRANLEARALVAFREYLIRYLACAQFTSLVERKDTLVAELSAIRYQVLIDGGEVQVSRSNGERDYGAEVEQTFARFEQGAVGEYAFEFPQSLDMNHVEAEILRGVASLHVETFADLADYVAEHADFVDPTVSRFDREIQFYVAYLAFLGPLRRAGLSFCYPRVDRTRKEVYDYRGFDLALAAKLLGENSVPVCNDFHLEGRERIIVVSGPNQGGKTTFARTFGQLHYLASLGCLVAGTRARLYLFDRLFTHFERQEDIANLHGKLEDELVRIHDIVQHATPGSVVIMNEMFTSTTFRDAAVLAKRIAAHLIELDALCVWVTFIDELSALGEKTVSMTSTVVPRDPARRTFKILRRRADGRAYAISIAEKYRLTYRSIKGRIGP